MNIRKICVIFLSGVLAFGFVSCKDKEDTTTKPYLSGKLDFDLDEYMLLSSNAVTMTPQGLKKPEKKTDSIGYYWRITPPEGDAIVDTTRYSNGYTEEDESKGVLTDGHLDFVFEKTGDYAVSCYSFMDGYSNSSASKNITILEEGLEKSLKGLNISEAEQNNFVTDSEGNKYYYTEIDGVLWFRNNLCVTVDRAGNKVGSPAREIPLMNKILGRMYSYEEAANSCPDGWELPTAEQWKAVCKAFSDEKDFDGDAFVTYPKVAKYLMGDCSLNGVDLWEYWPEVGAIDGTAKLALFPCGTVNLGDKKNGEYPDAISSGTENIAAFWTADSKDGMAYAKYLSCKSNGMYTGLYDKKYFGANVRCVKKK